MLRCTVRFSQKERVAVKLTRLGYVIEVALPSPPRPPPVRHLLPSERERVVVQSLCSDFIIVIINPEKLLGVTREAIIYSSQSHHHLSW